MSEITERPMTLHPSHVVWDEDVITKAATLSKKSVNYREAKGTRRCGTCVMFREGNIKDYCTLVKGAIQADDTCDRWYGVTKKVSFASLVKVGPEGYIHGYICVRPPCGEAYKQPTVDKRHGIISHADGTKIGQIGRKNPDGTYNIKHVPSKTLVGNHFATVQDAANAVSIYHNLHVLHEAVQGNDYLTSTSAGIHSAMEAMKSGDYTNASKRLAEASNRARANGFMDVQTHIDDTRFALWRLKEPGTVASPAPVPPSPETIAEKPWLKTGYVRQSEIKSTTDYGDGKFDTPVMTTVSTFKGEPIGTIIRTYRGTKGIDEYGRPKKEYLYVAVHADGTRVYRGTSDTSYMNRLIDYHNSLIADQEAKTAPPEPPVPAKLDFIPDWAKQASESHLSVDPKVLPGDYLNALEIEDAIRKEVGHATDYQGRFIPHMVSTVKINVVPDISKGKTYGDFLGRRMRLNKDLLATKIGSIQATKIQDYDNSQNWWSGADPQFSLADQVIAHEFGHGVHDAITALTVRDQQKMWNQLSAAIGVSPPTVNYQMGNEWDLNNWVKRNKAAIAKAVSKYGSKNSSEMQAELWSEYTMKANPRPTAKAYGDFIMRYLPYRTAQPH